MCSRELNTQKKKKKKKKRRGASPSPSSNSRVALKELRVTAVPGPKVVAHPLGPEHAGRVRGEEGGGVGLALEDLQGEALGGVAGDVAVHEPAARVVGLEGDDDEALRGQEDDVAARRVVELQVEEGGVVGLAGHLLEDGEVVAVEVDLHVLSSLGSLFYIEYTYTYTYIYIYIHNGNKGGIGVILPDEPVFASWNPP